MVAALAWRVFNLMAIIRSGDDRLDLITSATVPCPFVQAEPIGRGVGTPKSPAKQDCDGSPPSHIIFWLTVRRF
jgi:hypothetical protein